MKKNNSIENTMIESIMDEETMQAVVEDNIGIVPKNQRKKFDTLSLQHKVQKIKLYQDLAHMREEAKIKNSDPNKVKELFDKRDATVEDAKAVLQFCSNFIDNYKIREIEKIDAEIQKLEEMKLQFA